MTSTTKPSVDELSAALLSGEKLMLAPATPEQTLAELKKDMDDVYRQRNNVAALAAAYASRLGMDVGLRTDPDSPGWSVLCIMDKQAGELSFHVPHDEFALMSGAQYTHKYDGASKEETMRRVRAVVEAEFGGGSAGEKRAQ